MPTLRESEMANEARQAGVVRPASYCAISFSSPRYANSVKAMKGSYDPAKRTDLAAAPEPILVPSRLDPPNVRLYSSGAAVYEQTVDSIYFAA
jgi:hypothetical protein